MLQYTDKRLELILRYSKIVDVRVCSLQGSAYINMYGIAGNKDKRRNGAYGGRSYGGRAAVSDKGGL